MPIHRYLSSVRRNARSHTRPRGRARRPLNCQQLEQRQLLAGDMEPMHHETMIEVTETAIVTHHDSVPRFAANPTHVAVQDGLWSDPATWNRSWIPGRNARVSIPEGMRVTYDLDSRAELNAVEVGGYLDFYRWQDTSLRLNELMVLPTGSLVIGTEANPMSAQYKTEIVFTDTPGENGLHFKTGTTSNPGIDPSQYGNGLIVFGRMDVHGAAKTPFVRAVGDIENGNSSILVDTAITGWRSDDELVIPETAQTVITKDNQELHETEIVGLQSIDGMQIHLDSATTFDHLGVSENRLGVERYPHIANISRSIVFRSENPNGVRGHFAAMGNSQITIANAEFRSMGRTSADAVVNNTLYDDQGNLVAIGTNQIARYPVHMHHLTQPFQIDGIVVRDGLKWGLTVHGSDNGVVSNNVIYDVDGAGIVTEDGTETGNSFLNNLVVKVDGGHQKHNVRGGAASLEDAQGKSFSEIGADGSGFWLRASEGTFEGNVVYDAVGYGFNFNGYYNHAYNHDQFEFRQIDSFVGNETVSSKGGLWFTWSQGHSDIENYQPQSVSDFLAWHVSHEGVNAFHEANLTLENITVIADPVASTQNHGSYGNFQYRVTTGLSFQHELYTNDNLTLKNIRVEGANIGIIAPTHAGPQGAVLQGATLGNYINIAFQSTAIASTFNYSDVEFIPTLTKTIAGSFPDTVADVWHESDGISRYGWQRLDAANWVADPNIIASFDAANGQLNLVGTEFNDGILLTEKNGIISVTANGNLLRIDRDEISRVSFVGLAGNDILINFTDVATTAFGGDGNDIIAGGTGNDFLVGGAGDDILAGRQGFDTLVGNEGDDIFDISYDLDDFIVDLMANDQQRDLNLV